MSLEKMGLGGVLIMDVNQAVSAMGQAGNASQVLSQAQGQIPPAAERAGNAMDKMGAKASDSAGKTKGAADQISGAVGKLGGISSSLGMALAPLSAGFGLGIKEAADFEKQVSALGAVSLASEADMKIMTAEAKRLGVVTTFSATQAAQAMENLSRAGADTKEIVSGIKGVLSAAAAEGMDLGTAADLVAAVVRGMGLEFDSAGKVADVLALASAKTNTDMIGLGEAFKYAASQSRSMKIDLETTAAMLGTIADAGLKGSIGGTSFAAMLKKLAKPSEAANAWLKANRIEFTKTADGGLDVVAVSKQISAAMSKETDVMKAAAIQQEVFGDRGVKAFSAIDAAIKGNRIDTLVEQVKHAEGTSEVMAKKRLENFHGSMTLLMSSVQVFFIETFGAFLKPMAGTITSITDGLNNVILVLQALNAGTETDAKLIEKYGATTYNIAVGIKDGFDWVITTLGEFKREFMDAFSAISGKAAPDMIRTIAKVATVMVLIGGLAAPVLIAFGAAAGFIASTVIPIISTIGEAVLEVAGTLTGWGAIAVAAFLLFRNQGESVGQTFMRIFNGIFDLVNYVIDNAIMPFAEAFTNVVMPYANAAWTHIKSFFYTIREYVAQVVGGIIEAFKFLAPFFKGLFEVIGGIIGGFVNILIMAFRTLLNVIQPVLGVIKDIALWIVEKVVNGILMMVKALVQLADAMGMANSVPRGFREFAAQGTFSLQGQVASQTFNEIGKPTVAKDKKEKGFIDGIADAFAKKEGDKNKPGSVNVDLKVEDKRKLDISTCTKIDGREVALANGKAQQEIHERNGFKATPWQRRVIAESGAAPVGGLGSH